MQLQLRSKAEVTIVLKNQGEEAYKPKEYGKSIVIRRAFTRDGGSSWRIMSKDGTLISNKRDELAAICDHMNVQVDNPMNVLTQGKILAIRSISSHLTAFLDAARQFLNASHPSDKYKVCAGSRSTDNIIQKPFILSFFFVGHNWASSARNMILAWTTSTRPRSYFIRKSRSFQTSAQLSRKLLHAFKRHLKPANNDSKLMS